MLERVISDDSGPLAYVYDMSRIERTEFTTPDSFAFQVGLVRNVDLKTYEPHIHTAISRTVVGTSEFLFVVAGMMNIVVLDERANSIAIIELRAQQAVLQIRGGHAISTSPETIFFEIKQGPYSGRDADKYVVTVADGKKGQK